MTKLILTKKDDLFGDKQLSQCGRIEALYLQTDRSSRPVMAWSAYMVTDDEILDCEFGTDRTGDSCNLSYLYMLAKKTLFVRMEWVMPIKH